MTSRDPRRSMSARTTRTRSAPRRDSGESGQGVPCLLLAWHPRDLLCDDRAPLSTPVIVGRSSACTWSIKDELLSRDHFEVEPSAVGAVLRDLGSRNGTCIHPPQSVHGQRLEGETSIAPGGVISAGDCVFVLADDIDALALAGEEAGFGFAGRYHSAPIVRELRVAARTGRHILLEGESGTGKELAARAVHQMLARLGRKGPLVTHNAALFGGDDDAVAALFGVVKGAYTGVEARSGAIEEAHSGTLFLDEVHNLPARAQRTLLRVAEEGLVSRLGRGPERAVDVRLVLGTNVDVDEAVGSGTIAHDLVARLHRVMIPSLDRRRADIPSLLAHLLETSMEPSHRAAITSNLTPEVVARLCAADYHQRNVRVLEEIVAVLDARLAEGFEPRSALERTLDDVLGAASPELDDDGELASSSSVYERHRETIIEAFHQVEGNLTRLEEVMKQRGLRCSRKWLSIYLQRRRSQARHH